MKVSTEHPPGTSQRGFSPVSDCACRDPHAMGNGSHPHPFILPVLPPPAPHHGAESDNAAVPRQCAGCANGQTAILMWLGGCAIRMGSVSMRTAW